MKDLQSGSKGAVALTPSPSSNLDEVPKGIIPAGYCNSQHLITIFISKTYVQNIPHQRINRVAIRIMWNSCMRRSRRKNNIQLIIPPSLHPSLSILCLNFIQSEQTVRYVKALVNGEFALGEGMYHSRH